jgi:hypothetical protein
MNPPEFPKTLANGTSDSLVTGFTDIVISGKLDSFKFNIVENRDGGEDLDRQFVTREFSVTSSGHDPIDPGTCHHCVILNRPPRLGWLSMAATST